MEAKGLGEGSGLGFTGSIICPQERRVRTPATSHDQEATQLFLLN